METLLIQATGDTPEVELNPKGFARFVGKAMPENPINFFKPLFDWAGEYNQESITIDMKFEYFNTAVSKSLLDFLKMFEDNHFVKKVHVNWHFEEGDDDTQEAGEIYSDLLPDFKFEFYQFAEA
ncbi:MAG: DUF1987 domain-containing protein [Bacteroidetes bacterium]|jgi:hypothetical protein|nr:DUF1987 domain-containing protein [Bacteroidota bacterium]